MPINNFLLPGAKVTTSYEVANSCMFNDGDSAAMSRDQSANDAGTNTKGTLSVWLKMSAAGTEQVIYTRETDTSNYFKVWFENDRLLIQTVTSGSVTMKKETNRVFRDPSAWINVVVILDSTDGTAADRQQIWINGVRETSFANSTNIGSSANLQINTGTGTDYIGRRGSGNYYDGYMAELVWIDGTDYAATSFGEFDEDSPRIWKPKNVSGLTFGTNGFYLDFEDSSNLGNDANGGTDFTEANLAATDQASDSPTNNFCTLNPIAFENAGGTGRMSEGNLRLDGGSSTAHNLSVGTIAVNKGKWWFEAEIDALGGSYPQIGIRSVDVNNSLGSYVGEITGGAGYASHGTIAVDGSNVSTGGTTYSAGDIINVGLDLDNNKIYWYINGSLANSGGTSITNRYYTFSVSQYSNSGHWLCNFGASAAYTISSGNADGNGYGNFEHAPVSDYLSLCTKNLAEEG